MRKSIKAILLTAAVGGCGAELPDSLQSCDSPNRQTPFSPDRGLSVRGFIDDTSVRHTIRALDQQIATGGQGTYIIVPVNSPGGYITAADTLQKKLENAATANHVIIQCEKKAYSAAGILSATTEGVTRDATSQCNFMLHSSLQAIDALWDCKSSNIWEGFKSKTPGDAFKYPEIYQAHLALQANPNARHINIKARNINTNKITNEYTLTREQANNVINGILTANNNLARAYAQSTHLSERDVLKILARGDVYFDPLEAYAAGMIDTINGQKPSSNDLKKGLERLRTKKPYLDISRFPPPPAEHLAIGME